MSSTLRGAVKWFNDAKGFGFINHQTGQDVFVHYSVIESEGFKTLKDGELVEYELIEGPKGLHASKVYRLGEQATATSEPTPQAAAPQSSLRDSIEIERVEEPSDPENSAPGTETRVTEVPEVSNGEKLSTAPSNDEQAQAKELL